MESKVELSFASIITCYEFVVPFSNFGFALCDIKLHFLF